MKAKAKIEIIKNAIYEHNGVSKKLDGMENLLVNISDEVVKTFKKGGKVLFCGNGGSAADAQHLAAELSGKFFKDRAPLFAEALHTNSSFVTAVGNDYDFGMVYERAVLAKGKSGDILFGISTSGASENILRAMKKARELNLTTILLTGNIREPQKLSELCSYVVMVPSTSTPRVQEAHILIGHAICELVEEILF